MLVDPSLKGPPGGEPPDQRTLSEQSRLEAEIKKREQLFGFLRFSVVVVALFSLFLVVFLVNQESGLLIDMVKIGGGIGIGYGLRKK